MKILTRYIFKESLAFFSVTVFAFTAVLLTVKMLRFTSLIVNKGVAFSQIADVFVSIIPTFLEIAIPMAALLGVMLAFARLSGDSELVVMRTSGVSLLQLMKPVLYFGVLVLALSLWVSIYLRPWGYKHLNQALYEIARSRSTAGMDPGIFSKLGDLTIYSEGIDHQNGRLTRLVVDDKRDPNERKIIISQSGKIISNDVNRTITFVLFDGDIHEIVDGKYVITKFDTNSIVASSNELLSREKEQNFQKSQEMSLDQVQSSINEMLQRLDQFSKTSKDDAAFLEIFHDDFTSIQDVLRRIAKFSVEGGRRFSIPVAAFILTLIAMPLGVHSPRTQRTWGIGLSLVLGLSVFVVYYGFLSVGIALSDGGHVNPYAALWLPNAVILLISLVFIYKIAYEKWSSVVEGLISIDWLTRILRRKEENNP